MSRKTFDFMFKPIGSYEDFQKELSKYKNDLYDLLDHLKKNLELEGAENKLMELARQNPHSHFITNLLWLYRWVVSVGFNDLSDENIDVLFKFLSRMGIPDHVARKIKWAAVLLKKEGRRTDEEFWEKRILPHMEGMDQIAEIDRWLLYHTGLKQLFPESSPDNNPSSNISDTMETVLLRYIHLVNCSPELEDVFGVAIEKDMHRILEWLSRRQNG